MSGEIDDADPGFQQLLRHFFPTSRKPSNDAASYVPVYAALGLPDVAVRIAKRELVMSLAHDLVFGFVFPPALLPLWAESQYALYGFWMHWFTNKRRMTLVDYSPEDAMVIERARNLTQMMYIHMMNVGRPLDARLGYAEIAGSLGIRDIEFVTNVAAKVGKPEVFHGHPSFRDDPPLSCFGGSVPLKKYRGDFPHPKMRLSEKALRHCCQYEIHSYSQVSGADDAFRKEVARLDFAPPWLKAKEQAPVFDELIRKDDLLGAWMCLNSIGWQVADAQKAIRQLAAKANDPTFTLLAETWCSVQEPSAAY